MEISALTRSVVKSNHAVISPDGYINSNVPGWTNCTVNVIINEQMGAHLCQTLITSKQDGKLEGSTKASQIFFYIVQGQSNATVNGEKKTLTQGQFAYVPVNTKYVFEMPE
ncbi:MAG: cupin domain-containing protein, partial [Segetibacter sp.]